MRRNKMGAKKVTAYIGTQDCKFDSKAEYRYALWLESEREAGRVDQWVHHPGVVCLYGLANKTVATMEPDFSVWTPKGVHEYHEVKGMPTAAWRIKRALFEQQHPGTPYVVIDAGHPGDVASGMLPRLFDDRRRFKRERKVARANKNAERFLRKIGGRK